MDFGRLYNLDLLAPHRSTDTAGDYLISGWYPAELTEVVETDCEIEWNFRLLGGNASDREVRGYTDLDLSGDSQAVEWIAGILGYSVGNPEDISLPSLSGHGCIVDVTTQMVGEHRCEVLGYRLAQEHVERALETERLLQRTNPHYVSREQYLKSLKELVEQAEAADELLKKRTSLCSNSQGQGNERRVPFQPLSRAAEQQNKMVEGLRDGLECLRQKQQEEAQAFQDGPGDTSEPHTPTDYDRFFCPGSRRVCRPQGLQHRPSVSVSNVGDSEIRPGQPPRRRLLQR